MEPPFRAKRELNFFGKPTARSAQPLIASIPDRAMGLGLAFTDSHAQAAHPTNKPNGTANVAAKATKPHETFRSVGLQLF